MIFALLFSSVNSASKGWLLVDEDNPSPHTCEVLEKLGMVGVSFWQSVHAQSDSVRTFPLSMPER